MAKALRRETVGQEATPAPQREATPRSAGDRPAPPKPPPMRIVTRGWWNIKEREATIEEVRELGRREKERYGF